MESLKKKQLENRRKWMQKNPGKATEYKNNYLAKPENLERYKAYQKQYQARYRHENKVNSLRIDLNYSLYQLGDEEVKERLFQFMQDSGFTATEIFNLFTGFTADDIREHVLKWFDRVNDLENKQAIKELFELRFYGL